MPAHQSVILYNYFNIGRVGCWQFFFRWSSKIYVFPHHASRKLLKEQWNTLPQQFNIIIFSCKVQSQSFSPSFKFQSVMFCTFHPTFSLGRFIIGSLRQHLKKTIYLSGLFTLHDQRCFCTLQGFFYCVTRTLS